MKIQDHGRISSGSGGNGSKTAPRAKVESCSQARHRVGWARGSDLSRFASVMRRETKQR